jgi:hypothetical protein
VDDAAVVPDHKIALLPLVTVFVLFLDRMRQRAVRTGLWAPLVGLDAGKEARGDQPLVSAGSQRPQRRSSNRAAGVTDCWPGPDAGQHRMPPLATIPSFAVICSPTYHISDRHRMSMSYLGVPRMTSAVDKKTYWGLGETVTWICTRVEDCVTAMRDMNEEERIAVALFERKVEIDPRSLLVLLETNSDADRGLAAAQDDRGLSACPSR